MAQTALTKFPEADDFRSNSKRSNSKPLPSDWVYKGMALCFYVFLGVAAFAVTKICRILWKIRVQAALTAVDPDS